MRLAAHLWGLECGDVEDRAVGGEKGIEFASEGGFGVFFRKVLEVERLVGRNGRGSHG